jgi:hypothetical protein
LWRHVEAERLRGAQIDRENKPSAAAWASRPERCPLKRVRHKRRLADVHRQDWFRSSSTRQLRHNAHPVAALAASAAGVPLGTAITVTWRRNEIRRQFLQAIVATIGSTILDRHVLALDVARLAKALPEWRQVLLIMCCGAGIKYVDDR